MKRVAGAVLLGLGVFLLILSVLVWQFVAPSLAKVKLNQKSVTVSEAQDATYLETSKEKGAVIRTDQDIRATRTVHGDVKSGNDERVVFDVALVIENKTDNALIRANIDRLAMDRRTSEAIACCNESFDGKEIKHSGISYKFPFDTEQKTYQYFDTTARAAFPMRFKGEEKVKGLDVYKFEQDISDEEIEEREVPGSLVGQPEVKGNVTATLVYNNVRTVWVEPVTGSIVRGQEAQKQVLRTSDAQDTVVLDALLAFTDETVTEQAKTAEENKASVQMISTIIPAVLAVLGLILLLVGLLLVRSPRRPGPRHTEERVRAETTA